MNSDILKVLIIGSGPAGFTAAIYACRSGLNPVIVTGDEVGGQLITTPEIENWPGRDDAPDGFTLMNSLQKHAEKLGAKLVNDKVVKVDFSERVKKVYLASGKEYCAYSVIVCTGARAKYLGLESETLYKGKGVSACATCDGFFFRNKITAVVGGGSAAFVEALYLTNLCKKVYLIHRRSSFRAEKVLVDKLLSLQESEKVEFILEASVKEVTGNGNMVTGIVYEKNNEQVNLPLDGLFVAIGHQSATEIFEGVLELNENGTVKTGFGCETGTSATGVFAAGDCADSVYRQAITSAGQGCKAALDVEKYLLENY